MKAFPLFTSSKIYLQETSHEYLDATKTWLFKTPERALNQAYKAALTIKSIEDEYFQSSKISTDSNNCSDYLMSFVKADFQRELTIAKLRLAEFKASCLVLGVPISSHLDKLNLLDEVLAKYISQQKQSAGLLLLPPVEKVAKIDSQPATSKPDAAIVDVGDVKKGIELDRSFSEVIADSIGKVKKELDSKAETAFAQKMQNPKIRISAAITSTAIKYTVVLVLMPMLYQQLSKNFFQPPASTATLQQELEYRSHKPE
jgi:hypothetical protein